MKKAQEKKLDVAEMRMLRWMNGVTKLDRIRIERETAKVGTHIQESRLIEVVGHIIEKRVMVIEVPWKIRRGRPKRRWLDNARNDLSERKLSGEEAQYRIKWKRLIRNIHPTYKWEMMRKKKKTKSLINRDPGTCAKLYLLLSNFIYFTSLHAHNYDVNTSAHPTVSENNCKQMLEMIPLIENNDGIKGPGLFDLFMLNMRGAVSPERRS